MWRFATQLIRWHCHCYAICPDCRARRDGEGYRDLAEGLLREFGIQDNDGE